MTKALFSADKVVTFVGAGGRGRPIIALKSGSEVAHARTNSDSELKVMK